ncbi:MAG TPA: Ppx/GppA family phosphatase [Bacteroidales bacterium]|nr:Ppx/GppA family phosphatase [Bacteroidales bacterium]
MLLASIDIGSNAVRLLFANVFEGRDRLRADKASLLRIPIRLGLDVFETGHISEHRVRMLMDTMKAFRLLIDVYGPASVAACATAAMREAANGMEVMEAIQRETGLPLRIINGEEEARIISSFNRMIDPGEFQHTLYVDVGGGSTELSLSSRDDFQVSHSFRIGTIRLLQEQVEDKEWERMRRWLRDHTRELEGLRIVGSGGNINKLTKLYGDPQRNTLSLAQLSAAESSLRSMDVEGRIRNIGLRPDRADVILPAARIYRKVMKWTGLQELTAPKIGLVDGLVLMMYEDLKRSGK